jgi:glucose-6-phosphate isomerase
MDAQNLWNRYRQYLCSVDSLDLALDISRMNFDEGFLASMEPAVQRAFTEMDALERGAIANPDEQRMVGHYWLRAPQLAPSREIAQEITGTVESIQKFAADVHAGRIKPPSSPRFTQVLAIGIGGSALGPMFVGDALGDPTGDRMRVHFIDNTDPDGIARMLETLKGLLAQTLCVITSKSGGTPDTRNGMIIVTAAYRAAGLDFSRHAVAVTMAGSQLEKLALSEGWIARFPMFDWIGGRTSELSAVGLLPAALQGIDIDAMLAGAAACDAATRVHETRRNPAALMALMWYVATDGKGKKDLVVLPYKDRLLLFSRYLQQLVM